MLKRIKKWVRRVLGKLFLMALKDPDVQGHLWQSINRPDPHLKHSCELAIDPWLALWQKASRDTADYVERHMVTKPHFDNRNGLFDCSLALVTLDGLFMEFGVGDEATSIRYLAGKIDSTIHGFDSFEGLPDAWFETLGKGSFSTGGKYPSVPENVDLHKGWFEDSLPPFLESHPGDAAFIHIDCDLYSSTRTVLTALRPRIRTGTVIQFDEYFNYPGWREHELKAFQEFIAETGLSYEYVGYTSDFSVAVLIT